MVDHGCIGFSSLAPRLYIWVVNQVLIVVPSGNSTYIATENGDLQLIDL